MQDHVAPIIHDGKNVIFIQRSSTKKTLPNIWSFPSGTLEEGESIESAAVRECEEEFGIKVRPEYVLATKDLVEFGVRLHFLVCTIEKGYPALQEPEEIRSIRWMTFNEFFSEYDDSQIGHGLVWLRANPKVWKDKFSL